MQSRDDQLFCLFRTEILQDSLSGTFPDTVHHDASSCTRLQASQANLIEDCCRKAFRKALFGSESQAIVAGQSGLFRLVEALVVGVVPKRRSRSVRTADTANRQRDLERLNSRLEHSGELWILILLFSLSLHFLLETFLAGEQCVGRVLIDERRDC